MYRELVTMNKPLIFSVLLFASRSGFPAESLTVMGSFDDVRSTETGHCYGKSVSLWKFKTGDIVGLLDVHEGLCGDPACSVLTGAVNDHGLSFKTLSPIYSQSYTFDGKIEGQNLVGKLNDIDISLKSNNYFARDGDLKSWCETWSKVPRCSGVKEYC